MDSLQTKIINWFLTLPAIKQVVYTRLFKEATDDVLETMQDDTDEKAEAVASQKLNNLLSNVDLTKLVTIDKQRGICYIGGERADDLRLANLKAEADALTQFDLWGLLQETPKELAQRAMFVSGESLADIQKGKSILYTLSTQKNIIDMLKSFEPKKVIHKDAPKTSVV